jgi:hypothetical protein
LYACTRYRSPCLDFLMLIVTIIGLLCISMCECLLVHILCLLFLHIVVQFSLVVVCIPSICLEDYSQQSHPSWRDNT